MSGAKQVYRVEVISYPTPDGKPFKDQPVADYEAAVEEYAGGDEGCPDWLKPISIDGWAWVEGEYGMQPADFRGHCVVDNFGHALLDVPHLPRVHFLSRSAASRKAQVLRSWGCEVVVHASKPIEWESQDGGKA